MVIEVQQQQFNYEIMKDAIAAIRLLETGPEKIQALNGIRTHDLCVTGAILSAELSKPHESGRVWVRPFMYSVRNTRLTYMNSMVKQ